MYLKALKIYQCLSGEENPLMADSYHNLVNLYQTRGDLKTACLNWQRSVRLYNKRGLPDAPKVQAEIDSHCSEDT